VAQCVALNSDGTLTATADSAAACPGYVLLSGSEYAMVGAIDQALGVPDSTQAMGWFMGPFTLVVFLYVAARCAGSVVNMFRS